MFEKSYVEQSITDEIKLLNLLKPDFVLTDLKPTMNISCKLLNVPLISLLNASSTDYYTPNIIFNKDTFPWFSPKGIGNRVILASYLWVIEFISSRNFYHVEKHYNLPKKSIFDLMCGDLSLLCDIPEFAPTSNLPDNFKYIGPVCWIPKIPLPEQLNHLDPNRPVIYLTIGSTGPTLLKLFFDSLADTNFQCVLTTGNAIKVSSWPKNFMVFDFLPAHEVLKKSNMVICHGGNNTIYQAISYGTPIIGIATNFDQQMHLQRVEALELGLRLPKKVKKCDLQSAVDKILTNQKYKNNVERYKKIISNYGNGEKGVALMIAWYEQNASAYEKRKYRS